MPISKKDSRLFDLRKQAATIMQIDEMMVFVLPATPDRMEGTYRSATGLISRSARSKPVLAVWTQHLSHTQILFCQSKKNEIKKLAADCGAKIYMSKLHPELNEKKEHKRRKSHSFKNMSKREAK